MGYGIHLWHKAQYIYITVTDQRYKARILPIDQYHINRKYYCILEKIISLYLGEKKKFSFFRNLIWLTTLMMRVSHKHTHNRVTQYTTNTFICSYLPMYVVKWYCYFDKFSITISEFNTRTSLFTLSNLSAGFN